MDTLAERVSSHLEEAFWEEERQRTPLPARVACLLGIMAFGAFYFLDPFVSEDLEALFVARTVIIVVHLMVIAFSFTELARRHFQVLALLPCFAIGLGVVAVTQLAGGGVSRYHEALLLTFLAYPLVVPTRPISAGLSFAAITVAYGAIMVATGATGPPAIWMTNNFVLWGAVVIATAGVALSYRQRRHAFEARVAIARTSEQLSSALAQAEREKAQSEALLERITRLREERMSWLENMAHFLRHELRNQAVAIGTSLSLTKKTPLDGRAEQYVERANRSLGRMKRLVDSATEATSLESALAVEETEQVDLSALVGERVRMLRDADRDRRIRAAIEPEVRVQGNEDRLTQMLDKLVENALEHARPGGEVRVSVKLDRNEGLLSVENDGDLLPADKRSLFDAFVTLRKKAKDSRNVGLGLFVAKAIVESHGGTIEARDLADGTGACFDVRLPTARGSDSHG